MGGVSMDGFFGVSKYLKYHSASAEYLFNMFTSITFLSLGFYSAHFIFILKFVAAGEPFQVPRGIYPPLLIIILVYRNSAEYRLAVKPAFIPPPLEGRGT